MTDRIAVATKRLLARRAELEDLRALSEEARSTVTLDQQSVGRLSRMDAMQMQAMAAAQERQRAAELQRIAAALALIEDDPDEYGVCRACGEEIPDKRLEIDPAATRCVRCAR
ncbi:MAG: TraR/DksA C4-type zinc finger protein [Rhodobiaceae bacterium]|nr:TraR/DksA C4-type zinc finger protein [Rhodobiaceae bacterium]